VTAKAKKGKRSASKVTQKVARKARKTITKPLAQTLAGVVGAKLTFNPAMKGVEFRFDGIPAKGFSKRQSMWYAKVAA
jgi:hypothetical protein